MLSFADCSRISIEPCSLYAVHKDFAPLSSLPVSYSIERYCEEHNPHECFGLEKVDSLSSAEQRMAAYLSDWEEWWVRQESRLGTDSIEEASAKKSSGQALGRLFLQLGKWLNMKA